MGTEVQNLPGHYSMRDLNEESDICGGPLFYGDKTLTNRQYYNNYFRSVTADECSAYDKDVMKRTMLEHEAVFKNQVLRALILLWTLLKGSAIKVAVHFHHRTDVVQKTLRCLSSDPQRFGEKCLTFYSLLVRTLIDTKESEKLSDEKVNGPTLFLPDRNCKNGKESDLKFFCGNGVKTSREDSSRSEQFSRRRNDLADLNEPFQGATECSNPSDAAKEPQFFGLSREHLHKSHHGTDIWPRKNGYLDNNGNGKGWIMSEAEAGQAKNSMQSVPQALKPGKSLLSSQTMHDALRKAHEAAASDYLTDRSKTDLWSEKTASNLYMSKRNHDYSINKHPESVVPLHRPGPFAVSLSSDLSKSWSNSASSWQMANSSQGQKLMSVQMASCLNDTGVLSRSSQYIKSNRILDGRRPLNINSKPNSGFPCHVPMQNGFHTRSLSRCKEPSRNISSISYDYLNHDNDCNIVSHHSINNGSCKDSNSNFNDLKSRNIDLNVMLSNFSSDNFVSQSGIGVMDGEQKHEEPHAVLPWLRANSTCRNEAKNADRGVSAKEPKYFHVASLSEKGENGKGPGGKFMHNVTSVSCSEYIKPKRTEVGESSSSKKTLVPIFDMPHISPKKEMSSIVSCSNSIHNPSDVEVVGKNRKKQLFDMNLPCDADGLELGREAATGTIVCRERCPTKEANSRNQFDLNLFMSEEEASLTTIPSDSLKMKEAIDPEARVVLESEGDSVPEEEQLENYPESLKGPLDTVEQTYDELMRQAAESIVVLSSFPFHQVDGVISNPSESSTEDPLNWNGLLRSHDIETTRNQGKDYMPKPLVPKNFAVEETMTLPPTRTRKGPTRRGRQRRDFQRDILPGFASLSRHEMTEDLQTFGDLMRATGHSWNSGSTRRSSSRNGGGRGRRCVQVASSPSPVVTANETCTPLMQQINNIEAGLEDMSLKGWGLGARQPEGPVDREGELAQFHVDGTHDDAIRHGDLSCKFLQPRIRGICLIVISLPCDTKLYYS
ncbi:unnamed protein product [Lupinus luteus]|uniref:Uncharacterized protein n=1 Tax=Lupinus luteus TaxID=3873 RepID=A0AAV1WGR9_LUPLU